MYYLFAIILLLQIVYSKLLKGKITLGLDNLPSPHPFTSLPLQSSGTGSGSKIIHCFGGSGWHRMSECTHDV